MSFTPLFRAVDGTTYYTSSTYSCVDSIKNDADIDPESIAAEERMVQWSNSADKDAENVMDVEANETFKKYNHVYIVNSKNAGKSSKYDLKTKNEFASLYYDILKRYNNNTSLVDTVSASSVYDLGIQIRKDWELQNEASKTLVIILSGDTSISELLNGSTLQPEINILTVPFGTANALFLKLFKYPRGLKICENPEEQKRKVVLECLLQFVKNKLELMKVPFYSIRNKEGKELSKSVLLTTTGFHATLLKVASSPEYKKYGVERFVKASHDVLTNYNLENHIKLYNSAGKIYYEGESSYFGVFSTGRLEPEYDISPLSTLTARDFLSIKEDPSKQAFVENIMAGYGDENQLIRNFQNNENIAYESIPLDEDLCLKITPRDAKSEVSVCVDGLVLSSHEIRDNSDGTSLVQITHVPDSHVKFFHSPLGLFPGLS